LDIFDIDVVFGVNSINFDFIKLYFSKLFSIALESFTLNFLKHIATEMIVFYDLFSNRQTDEKYIYMRALLIILL